MSLRSDHKVKEFAQRLLAQEAGATGDAGGFRVCEKLRKSLGKLMGAAGYRAVFAHALARAGTKVSWLRRLRIEPDGTLAGLIEVKVRLNDEEMAEGEAVLVAELVRLLADVIERKRLEGQVAHAVEAEQLRLGRELHDGLAQEVTGATMILYTLEKQMAEAAPAYSQKLREVQQALEDG
jgi:signal transduction histidine kinase